MFKQFSPKNKIIIKATIINLNQIIRKSVY